MTDITAYEQAQQQSVRSETLLQKATLRFLEGVQTSLDERTTTRNIGLVVRDNLPLVLAALSDYADSGHTAGLALLNAAADGPGGENKASQRSEALEMLNDADRAAQLRQLLLELAND
ncbi:hypothetical protein ACF9IK_30435 [Kitasatospora hibisci]|uniref:hypothetical protein n=1 Tax=Kitasatospora hibisci TaxID=3369522 RepID=UPI0037553F2A